MKTEVIVPLVRSPLISPGSSMLSSVYSYLVSSLSTFNSDCAMLTCLEVGLTKTLP